MLSKQTLVTNFLFEEKERIYVMTFITVGSKKMYVCLFGCFCVLLRFGISEFSVFFANDHDTVKVIESYIQRKKDLAKM